MHISDAKRGAAISVKVMPRAKRTEVAGLMDDGTVKIRLTAPPVDGAANQALIEFLAEILSIAESQIDIVAGQTSERKLVSLIGVSPAEVEAVLQRQLASSSGDEAEAPAAEAPQRPATRSRKKKKT